MSEDLDESSLVRPRSGRHEAGEHVDRRRPRPADLEGDPFVAPVVAVANLGKAWQALIDVVADELEGRSRLWVLQAGAGTRPLFDLPEDAFLVGVDRDSWALQRNVRLDERVVAELADYQPWATGFDLITCWYVLDGLADPAAVLDRFTAWTATAGLVVLAMPNPRSPRGVWLRLARRRSLRPSLTATALRRRFMRAGFTPLLQVYFEDGHHSRVRKRIGLTGRWWRVTQALVRVLSGGLLNAARTDFVAVFRREE